MSASPLATPFPNAELQKLLKTNRRRLVSRVDGEYGFCAQPAVTCPTELEAFTGYLWTMPIPRPTFLFSPA